MKTITVSVGDVILNSFNPRCIRDAKFKKLVQSLKDFPEMLETRPIVVNKEMVVLGGNQRFRAIQELGWDKVRVVVVDWSEKKQREFIIKDNNSSGEWDWEDLANNWDGADLKDWGVVPDFAPVYAPTTDPTTDSGSLTDDEINTRKEQMEKAMSSNASYREVICPNCHHQFLLS